MHVVLSIGLTPEPKDLLKQAKQEVVVPNSSHSGKWVSEICESRKSKRIWLGMYPTPKMDVAAYDVVALSLRGGDAVLNFREFVGSKPEPGLIRNAAGTMKCSGDQKGGGGVVESAVGGGDMEVPTDNEFVDLEDLFDMPNLLVDMAKGYYKFGR
ncbi:hypothetical protein L6452_43140 [Arctium lappa]|uniref:Uncharacterized protein n=1 Tax=Arctium lappa TaxID=4217 RepID=A0ACB8XKK1_ARCLA|nr:hypothetical protein L6452_43140 [Arctium lappa]